MFEVIDDCVMLNVQCRSYLQQSFLVDVDAVLHAIEVIIFCVIYYKAVSTITALFLTYPVSTE
jgi:hypothetical protein